VLKVDIGETLSHGQKCLRLFLYYEAYYEHMGLKSTSNGRLDIALSNAHTLSPRRRTFQTIDVTELAWRLEIDTELLVFALISQLMRRCLEDISRRCVLAL